MGFWSIYLQGWKKGVTFTGIATRKEFWIFVGVNYAVLFLILTVIKFGIFFEMAAPSLFGLLYTIIALIYFIQAIPTAALGIRRMHDISRSGLLFGIPYLFILLNKMLHIILPIIIMPIYSALSAYMALFLYLQLYLDITLFWVPTIFIVILCCFKSKVASDNLPSIGEIKAS